MLDSVPGLYRNILVFDFKSLYPSLIRTFNIDPLTHVPPGGRRPGRRTARSARPAGPRFAGTSRASCPSWSRAWPTSGPGREPPATRWAPRR